MPGSGWAGQRRSVCALRIKSAMFDAAERPTVQRRSMNGLPIRWWPRATGLAAAFLLVGGMAWAPSVDRHAFSYLTPIKSAPEDQSLLEQGGAIGLPSDKIRRLQELFSEMGLYLGPVDGRANPDLNAAIERYRKDFDGNSPDPSSPRFLAHVEGLGLKAFLENRLSRASAVQRERARNGLMANPQTRDLVEPTAAPAAGAVGSEEAQGLSHCRDRPAFECLIGESLRSAGRLVSGERRDWALADIVSAYAAQGARSGDMADVLRVARMIEDPLEIVAALRRAAIVAGRESALQEAISIVQLIPDPLQRATILRELLEHHAGTARASDLLNLTEALRSAAQDEGLHEGAIAVQAGMALGLWKAGQHRDADRYLADASKQASGLSDDGAEDAARANALIRVAAAFAAMNKQDRARHFAAQIKDPWRRGTALLAVVRAQIHYGDLASAWRDALSITNNQLRSLTLAEVGIGFAQAGARDKAREAIARATEVIRMVAGAYHRAYAQRLIGEGWLSLGEIDKAVEAALAIEHRAVRADALWRIAHHAASLKRPGLRADALSQADTAIEQIESRFERGIAKLGHVAVAMQAGDREAATQALHGAVAHADGLENAWSRARAFARSAEASLMLVE